MFCTFSLSSKIQTLNKNLSIAQETLLLIIVFGCSSHLLIEHLLNCIVFNDMLEWVTDKAQHIDGIIKLINSPGVLLVACEILEQLFFFPVRIVLVC